MSTLRSIANDLSLRLDKKTAKGTYTGFDITLIQKNAYLNLYITFNKIPKETASKFVGTIKKASDELSITDFKLSPIQLVIMLNNKNKSLETKDVVSVLDFVLKEARDLSIEPNSKCIYCGLKTNERVVINKIHMRAHKKCVEKDKEMQNIGRGYVIPIIGALLGSIFGAIPYFLMINDRNILILQCLIILVGPGTYYGYKKIGKVFISQAKYIIAIVTSITAVFNAMIQLDFRADNRFDEYLDAIRNDGWFYFITLVLIALTVLIGYKLGERQEKIRKQTSF